MSPNKQHLSSRPWPAHWYPNEESRLTRSMIPWGVMSFDEEQRVFAKGFLDEYYKELLKSHPEKLGGPIKFLHSDCRKTTTRWHDEEPNCLYRDKTML
ncbi:hypothetical protein C5167_012606 [Papaver somniferum]|uniref:Uncharacterized protein n=1 Tax=Papaver somniferum TaxID=3469 RepID=A0A4Y7J1V8_PAPSO|nr:hypothetical protein C5167_012606 [Papaver somniferum]